MLHLGSSINYLHKGDSFLNSTLQMNIGIEAFHLVVLVSGTLDSGPYWIYMYIDNSSLCDL